MCCLSVVKLKYKQQSIEEVHWLDESHRFAAHNMNKKKTIQQVYKKESEIDSDCVQSVNRFYIWNGT